MGDMLLAGAMPPATGGSSCALPQTSIVPAGALPQIDKRNLPDILKAICPILTGLAAGSRQTGLANQLWLSFFGNSVDRKFVGAPPIPQKNAEWMGHGSL
jgi:hypothetical protein